MEIEQTERGFDIVKFNDFYGVKCSLQKSSLATEDAIWLGVDDVEPKILASSICEDKNVTGWANYPIPKVHTRMHLNREQVRELLLYLRNFVETGEIK